MGRNLHEKKKVTRVSEEKEQKKIRDSILKVFQARLSSPGKGGALLVAEPKATGNSKHIKQKKHQVVEGSTSTDDSSCESMSGRGRKRTKSLSRKKSRKNTKHKKEVEKDTAVARHLRVAHGITGSLLGIQTDVRSQPKMYSHSRITQKVGLIRTGTKSELASRGIVVPEHISKQTDEEIRKMSEEAEAEVHMAGDMHAAEKLVLSRVSSCSSERKSLTPASVDRRPLISVPSSVESIKDRQSPCEKFPENLPVEETVAGLLVTLKYHTKNLYPGRDYLRETHDELLKLLKQNAPRSATPTRLPVFNTITKSGSVRRPLMESFTSNDSRSNSFSDNKRNGTDGVTVCNKDKRDMISEHAYSFDEHISMVPKINFADKNPFPSVNDGKGKYERDVKNSHSNGLSSIKRLRDQNYYKDLDLGGVASKENNRDDMNLHHLYNNTNLLEHRRKKVQNEIKAYIDTHKNDHSRRTIQNGNLGSKNQFSGIDFFFARSKLVEDDYFFPGSSGHDLEMPKSPVLKSRGKLVTPKSPVLSSEATNLLQVNDMFEPMEIDISTKPAEAVNLLQQNDLVKDRSKQSIHLGKHESDFDATLDWVKRDSRSNSQCSHCSQDSGELNVKVPTRQPDYMPSFHGNYYSDHMATGDLSWQQKSSRVKVEAMDILDYADHIGRDSYMDCRGDQNTVPSVSTSTPHSPVLLGWRALDTVPHRKTVFPTSPKSPDGPKFYPKKMY